MLWKNGETIGDRIMSRIQRYATEIGLLICERFSDATLSYIAEWDPDLHYDVMRARKQKGIKDK